MASRPSKQDLLLGKTFNYKSGVGLDKELVKSSDVVYTELKVQPHHKAKTNSLEFSEVYGARSHLTVSGSCKLTRYTCWPFTRVATFWCTRFTTWRQRRYDSLPVGSYNARSKQIVLLSQRSSLLLHLCSVCPMLLFILTSSCI